MKNKEVKYYYEILNKKNSVLLIKRIFDFSMSIVLIILFSSIMLIIAFLIKCTSSGPVLFKQIRITRYGKPFKILKFRTMIIGADVLGSEITVLGDSRITKIGKILRKTRLDEFPQLFNIFIGQMSFVGTRPETQKYVNLYKNEMKSTLLLPAGVTSLASIKFRNEEKFLKNSKGTKEIDDIYINKILPQKMAYNLEYIKKISFVYDIYLIFKTIISMFKAQ